MNLYDKNVFTLLGNILIISGMNQSYIGETIAVQMLQRKKCKLHTLVVVVSRRLL